MRARLLRPTLAHAVSDVRAYRELFGDDAADVRTLEDLPLLPITDKEMMLRDLDSFRSSTLPTAAIQHTSGTSRRALVLHRSPQELEFIREFFNTVNRGNPQGEGVRAPVVVSVMGNYHGDATPIPYPGRVFDLRASDPYWNLEQIVTEPWKLYDEAETQVVLVGLESQLRILTCRLIESGFDFGRSRVIALYSTGDLLTRRLRHWYSTVWNAPMISRYSMTEIFGGANPCRQCGDYHFDGFVIPEAVDPISREPVSEGYAALVLTALHPFVQKQPIIRYWTGDLAKVRRGHCRMDDFGFQIQGRLLGSIVVQGPEGRAEVLVSSAEAYDVIDDFAEVACSEMFPDVVDVQDRSVLGHLRFQVAYHGSHLRIQVETRFTPYAYIDATRALCAAIRDRIVARQPDLQRRLERGDLTFEVTAVPPRTLRAFTADET
jgi:phenylacetate-coenzyme A ligase PaaK-like adenylate-forming protein